MIVHSFLKINAFKTCNKFSNFHLELIYRALRVVGHLGGVRRNEGGVARRDVGRRGVVRHGVGRRGVVRQLDLNKKHNPTA